ncbi:MAG TPA: TraM recognition domain-containing protein, partial [Candidatus Absconditabacterales bacterium]|nr:TraM recognition domain-containing protein [Candidatus Absconditabacterales bacterium]
MFSLVILIIVLGVLRYTGSYIFFWFQQTHRIKQASSMRYLMVRIQNEVGADQSKSTISTMKQNIELMNQFLKNMGSLRKDDTKHKHLGQSYISLELIGEDELIKFVVGCPKEYFAYCEQTIGSFFPGSSVDPIPMPKLLIEGKYASGGEIVYSKDFHLPVKTYEQFEADPMDSILSSFSKLTADENLAIQLLISPIDERFIRHHRQGLDMVKKGKKKRGIIGILSKLFSGIIDNLTKGKDEKEKEPKKEEKQHYNNQQSGDIDKKFDDELFDVRIKVFSSSPSYQRAEQTVQDMVRLFGQFTYSGLNSFKFKLMTSLSEFTTILTQRLRNVVWSPRSKPKQTIMSIKELSSLYHFPHSRFNKNPRIRWQKFKIVPAPDYLPNQGLLIGYNIYSGVHKEVRISDEDRFRHFYCIGQTGTGKTTALLTMAKDDLINGRGFTFIDPHGDFCEKLLDYFPKDRIDDLIYFNIADFDNPLGFNVLEAHTQEERDVIISDLIDMFVNMYGHEIFGPRIQDYFRNACYCLMEQPDGGTMSEIVRLFVDGAFNKIKVDKMTNPVSRAWREKTYKSMGDREKAEMIPYFQAKFSPFTDNSIVRNIVGQPQSSFNFFDAMQNNKVILVNLSKGLLGEESSQLLGRFISTQIKVAALKRASMLEHERNAHYLYVDEFQNYVSKSFESVLSEARKYKIGLAVAHQYIDQLKQGGLGGQIDLSKAIFGNVGTMMAYKVGAPDAEFLEKEFAPEFNQLDLVNMDKFKGVMKLSVGSQPTRPFSISILNPYTPPLHSIEKKQLIKEISALKRGRKKDLVEKEIFY